MSRERLHQLLDASTSDLFAAYDVPVERRGFDPDLERSDVHYAGIIGFTGEAMRGTLLLIPSDAVATAAGAPANPAGQRDWIGELANQLLGRLKTRLLRHGIEVTITTPLVVHGRYIAPVPTSDSVPFPLAYHSPHGIIHVWIDADLAPGLELVEEHGKSLLSEGELMMF